MTEEPPDPAFESLLEHLREDRGFDFTGYKRSSLRRRVHKRMGMVGITDVEAYHDHLEVHPEEFAHLFDTILINVTDWFRDTARWQYLAAEILPTIIAAHPDGAVRVWSAGCATGEEAYSIAMLLAEALDDRIERLKVYATDVDEDALAVARRASYPADQLDAVPARLRERYITQVGTRLVVRPDLRRCVVFGRHDLVRDAPISRLDLVLCRNVLMYFNRETQTRVLDHLRFALADDGYLFLGNAEMMLSRAEEFETVDLPHRVFRKAPGAPPSRHASPADAGEASTVAQQVRVRDAAFRRTPLAQVVIDLDGVLVSANGAAQTLFGLGEPDIGRRLRDLELSYRPVELRSRVEKVLQDRQPMLLRNVERELGPGERQHLDVHLMPLEDDQGPLGVSVAFQDVTQSEELRVRLQRANQDLETAYEELQSTNEELEATNEELSSTIEELETTNEELQSSNAEQLEINHELTTQGRELDRLNAYLRTIVGSLDAALVVVDEDFGIHLWNDAAFELWGLRADEVAGRSLLHLDIGLDVGSLADPIREILAGGDRRELEMSATNRRGFPVRCRVVLTPLLDAGALRRGVVVLMVPLDLGEGDR